MSSLYTFLFLSLTFYIFWSVWTFIHLYSIFFPLSFNFSTLPLDVFPLHLSFFTCQKGNEMKKYVSLLERVRNVLILLVFLLFCLTSRVQDAFKCCQSVWCSFVSRYEQLKRLALVLRGAIHLTRTINISFSCF